MTVTRPRSGVRTSTTPVYRDHIITGTAAQLANVMANHRAAGTLVTHSRPTPAPAGRFRITVRLIEQPPPRPTRRVHPVREHTRTRARRTARTSRTGRRAAAITAAALAALTAAGYLLHLVIQLITAHWPLILGIALTLALIGARLSRTGTAHCPGCPR